MILSFKQKFPWGAPTNFKEKILAGTKIHSIRYDPHNRWIIGRLIHMAYGVRTKLHNCFRDTEKCVSTQSIKIDFETLRGKPIDIRIRIDDYEFYHWSKYHDYGFFSMRELAKNDGFDSVEDFFKWFNTDFEGKIIHWTNYRY